MMTSKERLRRAYFHEEMDRPGVYVRRVFPKDDPTYDRLRAYIDAETDVKLWFSARQLEKPADVTTRVEPHSEDFERHVHTLHTPAGDLRSANLVSLRGQPGLHDSYFLKDRKDAETYLSLPMPELVGDCERAREDARKLGDRGIVDVYLNANPGGHVADLFGSETFAMMTITDRDILHALCERHVRRMLRRLEYVLAAGLGPYFAMAGQEYLVPPLHGPKDFDDFNVRYDKPIIDAVHAAGGRMHVHCHGQVGKVFVGFLDMGADVLHPIEPPPMGDITAAEAKRLARGRMCLEGNLQIADLYERTTEQIRERTAALIADAFDDGRGLIVCPTASPYIRGAGETCFPRFKAMIDTVLAFAG